MAKNPIKPRPPYNQKTPCRLSADFRERKVLEARNARM
jgi:hypothetical protein